MKSTRLALRDPRTLARDIPGLFEALFPHVVPGVVSHLNKRSTAATGCIPVGLSAVQATTVARAMLFEVAVAVAEQLLLGSEPDWSAALRSGVARQRRHFDARLPEELQDVDKAVALQVAQNLSTMMRIIAADDPNSALVHSPEIPGYQWIASSTGDFAIGNRLIEVKCTNRHFSSADYRQILIYWMLSYLAALERGTGEWTHAVLVNPRSALMVAFPINDLVAVLGGGRSKVELLELFVTVVDERRSFRHA